MQKLKETAAELEKKIQEAESVQEEYENQGQKFRNAVEAYMGDLQNKREEIQTKIEWQEKRKSDADKDREAKVKDLAAASVRGDDCEGIEELIDELAEESSSAEKHIEALKKYQLIGDEKLAAAVKAEFDKLMELAEKARIKWMHLAGDLKEFGKKIENEEEHAWSYEEYAARERRAALLDGVLEGSALVKVYEAQFGKIQPETGEGAGWNIAAAKIKEALNSKKW